MNCYERTFRRVLSSEFFTDLERAHGFRFEKRIALVNNLVSGAAARILAGRVLDEQVVNEVYFVADHLDRALAEAGLTRRELGRVPHFTDCALVAAFVCPSDYLLYWDADVALDRPHDWITPSRDRLESNPAFLVANPVWNPARVSAEEIRAEALREDEDFYVGYGFSDQVFLVRAATFRSPIYGYEHPYSRRYPLAHIAPVFEQRVDSYMRRNGRLRLTYKHAGYSHPADGEGRNYPRLTAAEHGRRALNRLVVGACRLGPASWKGGPL